MKRTLILAIACSGCADLLGAPTFINDSAFPAGYFHETWAQVEELAQADIPIQGMTIHVYENEAEFQDVCPDVGGLGCNPDSKHLYLLGSFGYSAVEVLTEAAHQLGHLHFRQAEHNPDG